MQILQRQLADGFIDDNEYMKYADKPKYKYEYRNITSVVKGLYNIKNVIKDDIDYFITFPYVIKVDVVQVIANKIDLSIRMRQFFDYYLLNKSMPTWMSEGLPAIEKGKMLKYELEKDQRQVIIIFNDYIVSYDNSAFPSSPKIGIKLRKQR